MALIGTCSFVGPVTHRAICQTYEVVSADDTILSGDSSLEPAISRRSIASVVFVRAKHIRAPLSRGNAS